MGLGHGSHTAAAGSVSPLGSSQYRRIETEHQIHGRQLNVSLAARGWLGCHKLRQQQTKRKRRIFCANWLNLDEIQPSG
jgi:hypothetical protein